MPHNVAYFLAEQAAQHPSAAAVRAPAGREPDGAIRYVERSFSQLDAEASATALSAPPACFHESRRDHRETAMAALA